MVMLHPMDDDFKDPNGLWSFYIQWMMILKILMDYGYVTSNGWWFKKILMDYGYFTSNGWWY